MRIGRLGSWSLLSLLSLLSACGKKPSEQPPPDQEPVKQYHVGGTVSGLVGSLTLKLNGQKSLTREANGPFTFTTPIDDQGDYAVTLATPPSEQDCTVSGGSGKVSGAEVTSVQVQCTTRTYAIGGSVEGLEGTLEVSLGDETLRLTANGSFTFTTRLPHGASYAVSVGSAPSGQHCDASGTSGTVGGDVTTLSVRCFQVYTLDIFQSADGVLGQADFTHRQPDRGGETGANTLDIPTGKAAFIGGRLFVADTISNRILGFDTPATLGPDALFALGQTSLEDTDVGSGPQGLGTPEGVCGDGTTLAVADTRNSRVLLYSPVPGTSGASATRVLGQTGFTPLDPTTGEPGDTAAGCGASALTFPEDVFLGHGKLLVADTGNNRVLVWNTPPTTNGAPAQLVLGQGSFTSCVENDANGDGTRDATPSASTLWNPTGVWTDGTQLVVADSYNHRVLVWKTFPTTNGQPADLVLGQKDFTSHASALTASGMNTPYTVTGTPRQLFVSDSQNHRVLVWNTPPTTQGQAADVVLGQSDFTHSDLGGSGTTPSARSLSQPQGVLLAGPHVWISDSGNNRLLGFTSH